MYTSSDCLGRKHHKIFRIWSLISNTSPEKGFAQEQRFRRLYSLLLPSGLKLSVCFVVRSLFVMRDTSVMASRSAAAEIQQTVLLKLFDIMSTAISHTGTKTAQHLEYGISQRTVSDTSQRLPNKLFCVRLKQRSPRCSLMRGNRSPFPTVTLYFLP